MRSIQTTAPDESQAGSEDFRKVDMVLKMPLYLLALLALMTSQGCSLTGATTRQTISLAESGVGRPAVPIVVESVEAGTETGSLYAAGTYDWGQFGERDLSAIRGSLEDTIKAASPGVSAKADERLRLAIKIHRYLVASTNHSVDTLAAVSWCARSDEGNAIYQETFYATGSARFVGTLGGVKDAMHRRIVRRIAESAIILANGTVSSNALPRKVEGTYSNFDEAESQLPDQIRSWGVITASPPFIIPGTRYETVPWWLAKGDEGAECSLS